MTRAMTARWAGLAWLLACAVGCTKPQPANHEPFIFLEPVHYHVGLNPISLLAADLNNDGVVDLATTNSNSHNVSVLLGQPATAGKPDGTFGEHAMFDVGLRPRTAALSDVNKDGRLDLAVVNNQSDDLSILLGNGDGTFQKAAAFPLGRSPMAIAAGDLDHDGFPDLIVALRFDHLLVLLGWGNGTFHQTANYDPGDTPTALLLTDLNGDTHLDVIVSNNGPMVSSVTMFAGNGDGTLTLGPRYGAKSRPIFAALGFLNQDEHIDLAAVAPFANSLLLFMGDGRGGFLEPPAQVSAEVEPVAAAIGDFNGDGRNDLAIANTGSSDVSVLLGEGDGRFQPPRLYRANSRPIALSAVDFNQDGFTDLAVANNSSNDVTILMAISADPLAHTGARSSQGEKPLSP